MCIANIDLTDENELYYEYSCYRAPDHFNAYREWCLEGAVGEYTSVQCCNSEDRCNERLQLPLPSSYFNRITSRDPTTTTPAVGPTSRIGMGLDLEQVWDWDVIKEFHTF